MDNLNVREMTMDDVPRIVDYWTKSDPAHLLAMGVDLRKLPTAEALIDMFSTQLQLPVEKRRSFCTIWEVNSKPVGHCNTNPTHFGDYAFMHLHLWDGSSRKKGMGAELVKKSLAVFFSRLKLNEILCEPYALNPAPNKTLEKIGFDLEKEYVTTPGPLNFEQPVKRWKLSHEKFKTLYPGQA